MNKKIRYTLIFLLFTLVVMQFFGREKPRVSYDNPDDLIKTGEVPDTVAALLKNACYDCHSMETKYPWYTDVAPFNWFIFGHVNHGREKLNLSNWSQYDKKKKIKYLKDIEEVMEEQRMPLTSYILLHPEARLSDEEINSLITWSDDMARKVFGG